MEDEEKGKNIGIENPAFVDTENHIEKIAEVSQKSENPDFFEDLPDPEFNFVQKWLDKIHNFVTQFFTQETKFQRKFELFKWIGIGLAFHIFFIWAIIHYTQQENQDLEWCDGLGFLVILTLVVDLCLIYGFLVKPVMKKLLQTKSGQLFLVAAKQKYEEISAKSWFSLVLISLTISLIFLFLIIDTWNDQRRLMSFFGLIVFVLLAVIFSNNPARIRWRCVIWGLLLQFLLGLIILRWEVGKQVFQCLGEKITTFLGYTEEGSSFVYGYLVSEKPGVFMFSILSVIFFFGFITSMLFYMGYMQWLIAKIGWGLQMTVGTTPCESMNAAANIFLGQTEAPLLIKPFLPLMTSSELHCVMASGMATIAGSVLAAYISFNVSAAHLLTASVMSAPAALAASKLLYPETKKTKTTIENIDNLPKGQEANILDAASQGAVSAVFLVANIGGTLIAVLAFIGFLNGCLGWFCMLVGYQDVTIQYVLGKVFMPIAWLMGVDTTDLENVGQLLGLKSFVNEFVAYSKMNEIKDELSERSKIIATYALCGFANPASIGIQIAGFSTLAPTRRSDISQCAIRAYCAGSLACFMTACIAGTLIEVQ